jgi:hypothetical protein
MVPVKHRAQRRQGSLIHWDRQGIETPDGQSSLVKRREDNETAGVPSLSLEARA